MKITDKFITHRRDAILRIAALYVRYDFYQEMQSYGLPPFPHKKS